MNVTVKVTHPAGRLIPGIGSFQMGETFELPEDEAQQLVAGATGLDIERPHVAEPPRRDKGAKNPQESEG